jgi:hypothetical protein
MADVFIYNLTTIGGIDPSNDWMIIEDTSTGETKKTAPGQLPISTATQTALDTKVDENAAITGATKAKITYDAKGLVTAGADLSASDMPTGINAANISSGLISNAEFDYLNGLSDNIQTQLNATQTALDTKVDENAAITGATKTKITYDAKGLVTAGADLAASDLPTGIDAAKISSGSISNAEFDYLNGLSDNIQTQLNGKQQSLTLTTTGTSGAATLVGGTLNIPQYSGGGASGVSQIVAGTNVTISPVGGTGVVTINATGGGGGGGGTVTNVSALTLGTSGTDLSSTVANSTTTPVITLNVPNASASNRGALTSTDWSTFNGKQANLVSGTNIKTVNSTSLLGSGNVDVQATITGAATTITTSDLTVSRALTSNASGKVAVSATTDTELGYVSGVTSAIQTQIDSKQATLVSGTNIKTINSTSLLGSGDIVLSASPSGVAGAIQFSDGSAFASDAANLFWDDTNNRLGVGTNAPSATAHLKGSGSTSATTSLLVQNSAGTNALQIRDDRVTNFEVPVSINGWNIISSDAKIGITPYSSGLGTLFNSTTPNGASYLPCTFWISNFFIEGSGGTQIGNSTGSINASAKLQVDSTTKGFLPPRMTTTQKNAIASPAAGLVVYDNTTNKLCCYDGSTWNDLF